MGGPPLHTAAQLAILRPSAVTEMALCALGARDTRWCGEGAPQCGRRRWATHCDVRAPALHCPDGRLLCFPLPVQLCERCQTEIYNLDDCTWPTWVRAANSAAGCCAFASALCPADGEAVATLACAPMACGFSPASPPQFGTAPACQGECNTGDRVLWRATKPGDVPADQGGLAPRVRQAAAQQRLFQVHLA